MNYEKSVIRYGRPTAAVALATAMTLAASAGSAQVASPSPQSAAVEPTATLVPAGAPDVRQDGNPGTAQPDIIVTATRESTSLQKTPVALNVYSGRELLNQNITTIQALQTIDPSLQITQAGNNPYIAIRGIQSTNTSEVGNPSVTLARDGFFTNRTFSLGLSFYDLDRVEVLKGPQGTLFGRNSTGGLVNLITAAPQLGRVSGYATATGGNYGLYGAEGAINVPITDTLAVRVSGFGRHRDGYRHITGPGLNERSDDDRSWSTRAQVLFRPVANLDFLVRYQHDHLGGVGPVPESGVFGQSFTGDPRRFEGRLPSSQDITVDRVTGVANLRDLPLDSTLTYTGGTELQRVAIDSDYSVPGGISIAGTRTERLRTVNHEVRLASKPIDSLTIQVGGFYFDERNNPLRAAFLLPFGTLAFLYDVDSTSKAVFGQASYDLASNLKFTLGGRQTYDTIKRSGEANVFGMVSQLAATQKSNKFTYRFGLDWQVTPRNLIYAKYDTGYRPGGFSTDPANPAQSFGPETVKSVELGSKNRFLDNRLTLNGDVFYQVLNGFQATTNTGATINAGKTRTYGVELAANLSVVQGTRLYVNSTFLHGRFSDRVTPFSDGVGGTVDVSGNVLPNAPTTTLVGGVEQDIRVSFGTFTAQIDGKYSSRIYYNPANDRDVSQGPVFQGNAQLRFVTSDGRWNAEVFVRNFTNRNVFASAGRFSQGGALINQYQFQAPRTFGGQVGVRF